ncbi:hypothetical protein S83_003027 [Arachis hypogaea]
MSFEGHGFPTKLVTFKVMDISSVPHFENTVCLGGIMSIGISSEGPILPTSSSPPFTIRPGLSFPQFPLKVYTYKPMIMRMGKSICCVSWETQLYLYQNHSLMIGMTII